MSDRTRTVRTSATAPSIVSASCGLLLLVLSGCDTPTGHQHYERIGEVTFRRSFAGHENWTPSAFDSVQRSDPRMLYEPELDSSSVISVLQALGLITGEELLLDSSGKDLQDTIILDGKEQRNDTVYLTHDAMNARTTINIRNGDLVDQHTLSWTGPSGPALIAPRANGQRSFALVEYYYIMNGDNYKVMVYRKVGRDDRRK